MIEVFPEREGATQSINSSSLSEMLDAQEIDLVRLENGSRDVAIKILERMDAIHTRLEQLSTQGSTLQSEQAHSEYLQKMIARNSERIVRSLGGARAFSEQRQTRQVERERWWWFLDEKNQEKRSQDVRRTVLIGSISFVVLVVLVGIYRAFLAPDPRDLAVYEVQQNAALSLSQGDVEGALQQVDAVLATQPENVQLILLKGVLLTKLDRLEQAGVTFSNAEQLINDRQSFLLNRVALWIQSDELDLAIQDAQEITQANPDSAEGNYYLAKANELQGNYFEAVEAYQEASLLAEEAGNDSLQAMIRLNMATLMQAGPPQPTFEITPTS